MNEFLAGKNLFIKKAARRTHMSCDGDHGWDSDYEEIYAPLETQEPLTSHPVQPPTMTPNNG